MPFECIAEGTACEGMKLKIKYNPLKAHCKSCGSDFAFDITKPVCSVCGSEEYDMHSDEPLSLEEIEFETEK